jgi:hypothetical protein
MRTPEGSARKSAVHSADRSKIAIFNLTIRIHSAMEAHPGGIRIDTPAGR